jgi:hypothetical protein
VGNVVGESPSHAIEPATKLRFGVGWVHPLQSESAPGTRG